MNIRALLQQLTGSKRPDETAGCPGETAILAYTEGRFSPSNQARLETHLAKCDDCRGLLAFATREASDATSCEMISDKEVKQQTSRVLAYIELDESKRSRTNQLVTNRRAPVNPGWRLSYPRLASVALVVCAVGAGTVFWINRDQPTDAAIAALRLAMKDERRNQALLSGDIDHSSYSPKRGPMRGGDETDDLKYDRALNKVRFAEQESASAESRLLLARVLLAMAEPENTRKALSILGQLEAAGVQTAELFNDRGVGELQLGRYAAAVDYFTKATQKSPDDSRFLFNKALAEQKAGREAESRQDWNQFISIASDERLKAEARDQLDLLR
ncbi:MAG: zf-HC2 domain-containing protein [Blastocatellia bacterium]